MKNTIIFISGLLIFFILNSLHIYAEAPELSTECIKKMESRNEQRTSLIMKDIITTFDLDIDEHSYSEVTYTDLLAAHMLYGGKEKDDYYHSLKQNFDVASSGEGRLYVRPTEGYFLYKEHDNTNVMVHLKLNNSKWEVIDQKKKKGNNIEYKQIKCEREYLKKRNAYYGS